MSLRASWFFLLVTLALAPIGASSQESPEADTAEQQSAPDFPAPPDTGSDDREERPPRSDERAASGTPAPLLHGTLEITLPDAIRMGLENNLDVQVDRYGPLLADLDVATAWGAYDPEVFAEAFYRDTQIPNAFVLSGVDESVTRGVDGFGGLRGVLPLAGSIYSGQFEGARQKYNSRVQALSPEYTSGWSLSVTQPVLRDLIWNEPWTRVQSSRLLLGSSEDRFRRAVMDIVQRIEDAYWALIANEEAMRVANKSLETARALLSQTKTQFEVGVVSKVEVTEAEAGVSQREVERIRAVNQYRNQQDVLIDLVLGPNLRATSTLELRPTDRPDEFTTYEVDLDSAVARAFENRPELSQAITEIERSELDLRFARNQRLPALDGIFSYGQSGLAGDKSRHFDPCRFSTDPLCDPTDPTLDPSQGPWPNTFDDYDDSPSYVTGARLSIPFPNRTARSIASQRELELTRARTNMQRLEQQIIIEVRQAARNLKASQEGITAARNARLAAAEQLRAEEIRLQYGESTPFDVLQREEDLVAREREEIGAFQAYRTSVTALDRAQGTILRNRNIDIADVAPLR
jgi:outer membrane protein TolC